MTRITLSSHTGGAAHSAMMRISLAIVLLLWAKHQQHGVEASSRSVESAYDTNKSVFSPQGRLVQLDYVEVRDALCVMRSIVVVHILHLILVHDLRLRVLHTSTTPRLQRARGTLHYHSTVSVAYT